MMETEVLSFDAGTKISHTYHYDHADDRIIYETKQDVSDIMQDNRREQNANTGRWNTRGMAQTRYARIPLSLYYQLMRDGVIQDQERLRRWSNDPDNAVFRTKLGKV